MEKARSECGTLRADPQLPEPRFLRSQQNLSFEQKFREGVKVTMLDQQRAHLLALLEECRNQIADTHDLRAKAALEAIAEQYEKMAAAPRVHSPSV